MRKILVFMLGFALVLSSSLAFANTVGQNKYFVTATYYLKDVDSDEIKSLINKIVIHSRQEPGNIFYYETSPANKDLGDLTFIECWKDKKSLEEHTSTDFFKTSQEVFKNHFARPPEIKIYVEK